MQRRRPFDHLLKDKQIFSRWVRNVGESTVAEEIACTKALSRESADCLVNCQQFWVGGKQEECRRVVRGVSKVHHGESDPYEPF